MLKCCKDTYTWRGQVCDENSWQEGSMDEGYLIQEAMGVCHDIIGDMDKYAPWVWKEEEDE